MMMTIESVPKIMRRQVPRSEKYSRSKKKVTVPTIGPSTVPIPPITTLKITNTVQSEILNEA
jgi:hypothetical protein